jgi:hypothetical protein
MGRSADHRWLDNCGPMRWSRSHMSMKLKSCSRCTLSRARSRIRSQSRVCQLQSRLQARCLHHRSRAAWQLRRHRVPELQGLPPRNRHRHTCRFASSGGTCPHSRMGLYLVQHWILAHSRTRRTMNQLVDVIIAGRLHDMTIGHLDRPLHPQRWASLFSHREGCWRSLAAHRM